MATSSHWTIRHLFVPAPYAMSDLGVIVLQTLMRRPTNDDSVGPRRASVGAAHDGPAAAQVGFGSSAPNLIDIVRVMSGCPSTPDIPLRRGEYLDDIRPDPPLRSRSPIEVARMRVWTKIVDELLHPACAEIAFAASHRHILARKPQEELDALLDGTPPMSVTPQWHQRKKEIIRLGLQAPGVDSTFRLYDSQLEKMELTLKDSTWISGETSSLADVGLAPYINRLSMLGMSEMWTRARPRLTDWFDRVRARSSFKPSITDTCPPELAADMMEFGSKSWGYIKKML